MVCYFAFIRKLIYVCFPSVSHHELTCFAYSFRNVNSCINTICQDQDFALLFTKPFCISSENLELINSKHKNIFFILLHHFLILKQAANYCYYMDEHKQDILLFCKAKKKEEHIALAHHIKYRIHISILVSLISLKLISTPSYATLSKQHTTKTRFWKTRFWSRTSRQSKKQNTSVDHFPTSEPPHFNSETESFWNMFTHFTILQSSSNANCRSAL